MPDSFTRTFLVRQYECDPYGHVNNTNYLRYMLETGREADAAAGCSTGRCRAMGYQWRARATDIEYLRPLRYGERAEVRTWVAGYAGEVLRRGYECVLAGTEEQAARGYTESTLCQSDTGEAVELPLALTEKLCPAMPPGLPSEEAFPEAPPPPPGAFRLRHHMPWHLMERHDYPHDAAYLVHTEDAGMGVLAAHGWPIARMTAHGFAILLRRHQIEYLCPAQFGDELEVETWASNVRRASATRHFVIRRLPERTELVRVHTLGVWVSLETGRPIRIPAGFMDDFAPNVVA